MISGLYRALSFAAPPVLKIVLARRRMRGKEDPARIDERRGTTARMRPSGPLVWIHGASVGEALSALPLIHEILSRDTTLPVLVTTGTVTSAQLMAERLPPRALHQYVPLDAAPWVRRFFDHWRPDLAIWLESELWPNLVAAARARAIPLILVNARMSERSFRGWRRCPGLARSLLGAFDLTLAQSDEHAQRFASLGARRVATSGNLKFASPPLPAGDAALAALRTAVEGRRVWIAARVHPGEDAIVAAAHRRLKQHIANALAIIVPRHPARASPMRDAMAARGIAIARRSAGEVPTAGIDLYLADTFGELGLFYRLAEIAFVGGSLVAHGGQNPIEPAALGRPVLHGPHMENFAETVTVLAACGGARMVADAEDLGAVLAELFADEERRKRMAEGAVRGARAEAGVLERIMVELAPFLPSRQGAHAPA